MRKNKVMSIIKVSSLAMMICLGAPLCVKASSGVSMVTIQPAASLKANESGKSENTEKSTEKETPTAPPVKTVPELEKELSNIKGRNDEMNEKVSRTNIQIIETLKKLKSKKGISKKKIRLFNKNEEAIAGKLDGLSKLIEGLKENADRIALGEKKLADLTKSEATPKQEEKPSDIKASDKPAEVKINTEVKDAKDGKAGETVDLSVSVRNQLESLVWLQLDRNSLLLQIFDSLSEISGLLP